MRNQIDKVLEDLSTRDVFLFRIRCGVCAKSYDSRQLRFSKAGLDPGSREKKIVYDALYDQELRDARQATLQDATEFLNLCPICKRIVCDRCFLICEDLDMCVQCAGRLNETGVPVSGEDGPWTED